MDATAATPGVSATETTRTSVWTNRGVLAVAVTFALFCLNFGAYRVFGDGVDYYSFVQRLFGDSSHGSGYNFGTGLLNAPFYALGHFAKAAAGAHHSIAAHALPASITFASIFYALVTLVISAWLIMRIGLRHPAIAVAAAVFGTPLWYYASFSPDYTHASDAAVFSVAAAALYQALHGRSRWWTVGLGVALGFALAVRPYNIGILAGAVIALACARRIAQATTAGVAAAATFGLLLLVPLSLGTGIHVRANGENVATAYFKFSPLSPIRMLFTLHRGLFLWTPVTLLAVIGIVIYLWRPAKDRLFVAVLTAMTGGLLLMYASFSWWDAGWSFSMRFLASPVVFYAIGIAALLATAKGRLFAVATALVTLATVFSVFVGMNHAFGASQSDGVDDIVGAYVNGKRTVGDFFHLTWSYSRIRHVVNRL